MKNYFSLVFILLITVYSFGQDVNITIANGNSGFEDSYNGWASEPAFDQGREFVIDETNANIGSKALYYPGSTLNHTISAPIKDLIVGSTYALTFFSAGTVADVYVLQNDDTELKYFQLDNQNSGLDYKFYTVLFEATQKTLRVEFRFKVNDGNTYPVYIDDVNVLPIVAGGNFGFEGNATGDPGAGDPLFSWELDGWWSVAEDNAHEGSNSAHYNGSTRWGILSSKITGLRIGETYTFVFYAEGGFADLWVGPEDNYKGGDYYYVDPNDDAGFVKQQFVFTASATTMLVQFEIFQGTSFYVDDFHVYQQPESGKLLINEVNCNSNAGASGVELYNSSDVSFNMTEVVLETYAGASSIPDASLRLSDADVLPPQGYVTITKDNAAHYTEHGFYADFEFPELDLNAIDGLIIRHDYLGVMDRFNDVPIATSTPLDNYLYLRKGGDIENGGGNLELHWCEVGEFIRSTPGASNIVIWNTNETNAWELPTNWDGGFEPCECVDVIIPSGVTQPVISLQDEKARNITIESAASLTISESGSLTANEIAIDTNGHLFLNSSATEYSSLIVDGTVTGNANYNRYVNEASDNDLISAPVTGQTFGEFALINDDVIFATPSKLSEKLFGHFDNNTGVYETYDTDIPAEADITLIPGVGYRAGAKGSLDNFIFTGAINTGNVSIPISVGTGTNPSRWNLIGNPYPSYLLVEDFINNNSIAMDPATVAIYGYNNNTDPDAAGIWTIYNLNTVAAQPLIAPGQGFFIAAAIETPTDIEFLPAMRSFGKSDDFIQGKNTNENLNLKLQISDGTKIHNTDFYFNDNSSLGLDPGYDAAVFGSSAPSFSIYSHLVEDNTGRDMAIQSLSIKSSSSAIVPLGINAKAGEELNVSIAKSTLPEGVFVYLEDNVSGTMNLLNESDYIFTAIEDLKTTGRFFLRFKSSEEIVEEEEVPLINILEIYTAPNHKLYVNGLINEAATLNLFDMQGRKVFSQKLEQQSNTTQIDVTNLSIGIYIVQVKSNSIYKTKKVIIQ